MGLLLFVLLLLFLFGGGGFYLTGNILTIVFVTLVVLFIVGFDRSDFWHRH